VLATATEAAPPSAPLVPFPPVTAELDGLDYARSYLEQEGIDYPSEEEIASRPTS